MQSLVKFLCGVFTAFGATMLRNVCKSAHEISAQSTLRAADKILKHYAIILWTVTALTIAYLILLPPGDDVTMGIAWADLEALQGHFPASLSDLWLSRGIGYKLFLYLTEGLSRLIAGDALRARLYVFNAIYIALGLGLIACAYFAFLLRRDPTTLSSLSLRDRAETLALAALLFLPAVIWSWAQDTHISVLLCVFGIGLALSPSVRAQWCSGAILILLFSIKGVTALDFLFVLAAVLATGDRERIRRVVISAGIATATTALAYATILRTEFENILLAAQFQTSLPHGLRFFVSAGVQFAFHNPAIPVALLVLAVAIRHEAGLWTKSPRLVGLAIVIWFVPLAAIFTQREFFGYHYQGVILSSWLCLAALYLAQGGKWSDLFRLRSAPTMAKALVLLACCVQLVAMGISLDLNDYFLSPRVVERSLGYSFVVGERWLDCRIQTAREARSLILSADPELVEDGSVLNLTWLTYGLGLRSASRFFFPLPVFRDNYFSSSILTYEGPAIITYTGMMDHLAPIIQHLRADYRPLRIVTPCANIEIWMRANS